MPLLTPSMTTRSSRGRATSNSSSPRSTRANGKARAQSKEALKKHMKQSRESPSAKVVHHLHFPGTTVLIEFSQDGVKFHGFRGYYKGQIVATPEEIRPKPLSLGDLECIRTLGKMVSRITATCVS